MGDHDMNRFVPSVEEANALVLFDMANMAYRNMYASQQLTTADGRPSGHVYGTMRQTLHIIRDVYWQLEEEDPLRTHIMFCGEGGHSRTYVPEGAQTRRHAIYPEYKAGRKRGDFNPLTDVKKLVTTFPNTTFCYAEGEEADDCIATLVTRHASPERMCVIVSSDRDFWSLLSEDVHVYLPGSKKNVNLVDMQSLGEMNLSHPSQVPLHKAIFGDKSDNIPSVVLRLPRKQTGRVICAAEATNGIVTPRAFFDSLEKNAEEAGLKQRWVNELIDACVLVERNFELTQLRTDCHILGTTGPDHLDDLLDVLDEFECESVMDEAEMLLE
jgi:hypothetical protein